MPVPKYFRRIHAIIIKRGNMMFPTIVHWRPRNADLDCSNPLEVKRVKHWKQLEEIEQKGLENIGRKYYKEYQKHLKKFKKVLNHEDISSALKDSTREKFQRLYHAIHSAYEEKLKILMLHYLTNATEYDFDNMDLKILLFIARSMYVLESKIQGESMPETKPSTPEFATMSDYDYKRFKANLEKESSEHIASGKDKENLEKESSEHIASIMGKGTEKLHELFTRLYRLLPSLVDKTSNTDLKYQEHLKRKQEQYTEHLDSIEKQGLKNIKKKYYQKYKADIKEFDELLLYNSELAHAMRESNVEKIKKLCRKIHDEWTEKLRNLTCYFYKHRGCLTNDSDLARLISIARWMYLLEHVLACKKMPEQKPATYEFETMSDIEYQKLREYPESESTDRIKHIIHKLYCDEKKATENNAEYQEELQQMITRENNFCLKDHHQSQASALTAGSHPKSDQKKEPLDETATALVAQYKGIIDCFKEHVEAFYKQEESNKQECTPHHREFYTKVQEKLEVIDSLMDQIQHYIDTDSQPLNRVLENEGIKDSAQIAKERLNMLRIYLFALSCKIEKKEMPVEKPQKFQDISMEDYKIIREKTPLNIIMNMINTYLYMTSAEINNALTKTQKPQGPVVGATNQQEYQPELTLVQ